MIIKGKIKKGEYFDSVTLMIVGKEISRLQGVIDAAVVMGTNENKAILDSSGLLLPEFKVANDTDLLIGIKVEQEIVLEEVFEKVDEQLANARKKTDDSEDFAPRSIEGAVKILPHANLALISVAGKYAGDEAKKALVKGLHVMLFSDNVTVEKEVELKKFAKEKGLLVMGPDCGTAIINGVPLAFANVINSGNIGVVAASGTGLQEVTVIISNKGAGISQAIGTGGRDVKKDVGGIMFIESLKALAKDSATKVMLFVSKPPHESVIEKIAEAIENIDKEVVAVFLGADPKEIEKYGMHAATTLEEAALKAIALVHGQDANEVTKQIASRDKEIVKIAEKEAAKRKAGQKYLRGLFSGGTFCSEAQLIYKDMLADVYSNAVSGNAIKLENSLQSQKNTVVDLGEDEFTVGRPHPMIDFSLRNKRIIEEAKDPETAVILLDVVLGYGSNMDPAGELVPIISEVSKDVSVICSITGTDMDPQNRNMVASALEKAGAIIMPSNAAASKLAGYIVKIINS